MTSISKEVYLDWYKKMLLWRKFEEKAAAISIGDTITVTGQIKAMKENPGQAGQDNMMIQSLAQVIKPCDFK